MKRQLKFAWVAAAAVAALQGVATAQTPVDNRTYNRDGRVTPTLSNPGQARDYNTLVGGNGLNAPSNSGAYINSANAIISGDVYGLGGFHATPGAGTLRNSFNTTGLSSLSSGVTAGGYSNPFNTTGLAGLNSGVVNNQYLFQNNLPSANISYFNRRGYSVSDSRYLPNGSADSSNVPYYDRANTVANTGAIQQGLNQPGSSTLQTPFSPLYQGTNAVYAQPAGSLNQQFTPPDRRMLVPDSLNPLDAANKPLDYTAVGTTSIPNWQRDYLAAIQSPLFGPSPLDARLTPSTLASAMRARAGAAIVPPEAAQPGADQMASVDARSVRPLDVAPRAETAAPEQVGTDLFSDMRGAVREAAKAEPDFISRLNSARVTGKPAGVGLTPPESGGTGVGNPAQGNPALSPTSPVRPKPAQPGAGGVGAPAEGAQTAPRDAREARLMAREQRMKDWARDVIRQPIRTFAGKGQDDLNRYLMSAEMALRAGEYYNAAGQFGLAAQVAPNNPLPLLGRGHSLAAAGDYVSAVLFLQRGISRFPDIVAFDMDLPALVGGKDVFDLRRADLEKQLARVDSYELRFLLGYLEYYSGLRDLGMKDLRRAAEKAPHDSVIAEFPDMLMGKARPPSAGAPLN